MLDSLRDSEIYARHPAYLIYKRREDPIEGTVMDTALGYVFEDTSGERRRVEPGEFVLDRDL